MTIRQIYDLAIKLGISADPRGKRGVSKALKRVKQDYDLLDKEDKKHFDNESFTNPYSDTRILLGNPKLKVNKVLVGIDIHVGEMLLADRLNEKGEGIDLVIAHHPEGRALAALNEVMELQIDMLANYGVPVNVAESILRERINFVYRRFAPLNHHQSIDAARLLGIPFMCVHTPTDNIGWKYLADRIETRKFDTVGDVINVLGKIEELTYAKSHKAGPVIFAGTKRSRAGNVRVVEFTGGTEGAKEIYERLSHAGIGTVVGMHVSEDHIKEAKKHHMNLVVTGHMASDSIGINLFLDNLEKKGIETVSCSGLIRVRR